MKKDWLYIIFAFCVTALIFFGYYFVTKESNLDLVYKNWDGPSYIIVAKSLYDPQVAYQNNFINSGDIRPDWSWLPAHFPLYPLAIRAFSFLGYFQAMLLVSVGFGLLCYLAFYNLVVTLKISKNPLLLTLPFLFLSPRWFIVSHTGSSESMFLFFIIVFLTYLAKKQHAKAAIFIALAQLTRPQAAFFGLGMAIVALIELVQTKNLKQIVLTYYPYLSIPLAVLGIFTFYKIQTGDFWAFFSAISLTKNLQSIPFRTFSFPASNIETFWQEVNAYDYVIFCGAALLMFKKKLWRYGVLATTYFIPLIFLQHSDISRYAIPMLPFAFIAYSEIIEKKEFTWATFLMSPAIMLYAINFMDHTHGA
jgi:hypothetical protein